MSKASVSVPWRGFSGLKGSRPEVSLLDRLHLDRSLGPAPGFFGGTWAALKNLRRFTRTRLKGYAERRNEPHLDGTSQLSPYLHFGQIGPHTVALAVSKASAPRKDREAFLEELIVRRELAVNFVRFNAHYDGVKGCEPWAKKTLKEHRRDRRPVLYSER